MNALIVKFQQARALHQQGQLSRASAIYQEILKVQPRHLDTIQSLAMIAGQAREFNRAVELLNRAIQLDPGNAATYCNRGLALQELGQLEPALLSYDRAIALKPGYAVAYFNRGNALRQVGRWDAALADYDQAIAANPGFAPAYYNRGILLQEARQWSAAEASYAQAIALIPDHGDAHYNRGVVLQRLEQWEAALASYDRALAIRPSHAEAYVNRGVALRSLGRFDAALDSFDRAIAIKKDMASAYFNRGITLNDLKHHAAALANYDQAIALGSDAIGLHGCRRHAKMRLCDWSNFDAEAAALIERIGRNESASPPFHVLVMSDSAGLQKHAATSWVRDECPPRSTMSAHPHFPRRDKIRVGYFSADFHNHATAYLIADMFERHDRSAFEISAFSFGPDKRDPMRSRLQSACRQFIDVRNDSDDAVVALARKMQIDIAVDLKGLTQFSRPGIFSRRAAPLQVGYLGYPGTMGADYIDYLVADRTLIPAGKEQHYCEHIIFMPHSYQVNDAKRGIADKVFSREALALPRSGFIFCCFNNNFKITPDTFDGWMRILQRVEGSVLWLYEDNPTATANLRREAAQRNVDPKRLVFAPFMALPEHLARHRAADLFIDTLPYNAHTTASDALWAGLPVLTCMGEAFASRVAASLLTGLGLPELITSTKEHYEELAVELATDPQKLVQLKQRLLERRLTAPLFDAQLFTGHIEAAYTAIYERQQAGLPNAHVDVEAGIPKHRPHGP